MKDEVLEDSEVKAALIKKALGYDATEVIEEYVAGEEGEIRLSKKRITVKNVPPDVTAIKMLIDDGEDISEMSDEQLECEKQRLLAALCSFERKEKEKRECKKTKPPIKTAKKKGL